jgi:hypothetical protein
MTINYKSILHDKIQTYLGDSMTAKFISNQIIKQLKENL